MDLMQLVPVQEMQKFDKTILHTNYNCKVPSEADDIDSAIRGNEIIPRLRRWFLRKCILSRTHPYTITYLKSETIIRYEIKKHMTMYPKMLHPTCQFRYFWECFQIIVTLLAFIIVPILNAFYLEFYIFWSPIILLLDIIYFCDCVLWFFTGYIDKYTRNVVLDSKLVTSKYFRSSFFVDILSFLPLEFIDFLLIYFSIEISIWYGSALNFLIFLRIRNLLNYAQNIQQKYRISLKTYKFFEISTIIITTIHWATCLEYYVPNYIRHTGRHDEGSWIFSDSMKKRDTVLKKYILCLNRAVIALLCCTHYLTVNTWEDILLNMIFSLIGKGGFIYLLVQTMHLMTTYTSYNELSQQVQQLEEYTRYKKLPRNTKRRLHIYCNYSYKRHFEIDKIIMSEIPMKLQEELILYNHVHMLTTVELLKYLPKSIVVEIGSHIRRKVYLTNDVIIRSKTLGDELYFIVSGTVAVYTSSGKEICHLEEGAHFGEITLVMDTEYRIANVIAIETCEVGILSKADFQRVIAPYPYLINRLKQLAKKRLQTTLDLEETYEIEDLSKHPNINIS